VIAVRDHAGVKRLLLEVFGEANRALIEASLAELDELDAASAPLALDERPASEEAGDEFDAFARFEYSSSDDPLF
jgi:hypothetical protein